MRQMGGGKAMVYGTEMLVVGEYWHELYHKQEG
jgi:hypothetical protein